MRKLGKAERREQGAGSCKNGPREDVPKPTKARRGNANLPAGLEWKACDGHAMDSAARARRDASGEVVVVARAVRAARELDDEALAHEVGAICRAYNISDCRLVLGRTQPWGLEGWRE